MIERKLFESALEIADPQARQAFLDEACQGDGDLRAKVDALLKSHAAAGSFLDIPVGEQMGPRADNITTNTFLREPAADSEDSDDSQPDLSFLQPSNKPGSIGVLAHYEVLSMLGQGAFGIVFKAFDEKLHRLVAIKVMNPQMASTSPPRKRFLREARSAAAIKHENVVQVYSVEEQPLPYLVMEFIDGQTLKEKLDGSGPLETPEVLHIARQIASGLAAAQAMGLIHRDIKPANILLEQGAEQRVKISDFGLARAADDASLTRTGVISGTPLYMAPEQATGQSLDHRADLFSLGSVVYQMSCGRPPFRAATTVAVLRRVVEDTPRPLDEILPEIPDWLVAIVTKLLAKKPEDRFQTAKEVADLLARCQSELQLNGKVTCVPIPRQADDIHRKDEAPAEPFVPVKPKSPSTDGQLKYGSAGVPPSREPTTMRSSGSRWLITSAVIGIALLVSISFYHSSKYGRVTTIKVPVDSKVEIIDSANPDRRAAEYVLSIGGKVNIKENDQERPVTVVGDLPRGTFELTNVGLGKKPMVSNAGLAVFKDCKHLNGLDLNFTEVSDEGLAYFKDCKNLGNLALAYTQISDAGLVHFNEFKNLSMLYLDGTKVSDAGLAHLKDCKNFLILTLSGTRVSDASLERLADFPKLSFVAALNTKVTEAGVKKLSAALPGCKIEWDGGVMQPKTGWHGWSADAPPPAIAPFDAEQAKQHQAAWAKYLSVPVEYTNSLGMKFRLIPPGEFLMGSTQEEIEEALKVIAPSDKHWQECIKSRAQTQTVILTQPIYLGLNEVTQAEYEKVMGQNPSHFASKGMGKEAVAGLETTDHPVEAVSWNDAAEFCAKLSQKEKFKPFYFRAGETITPLDGTGYRLPSEAEWEFACRAGTTTKYWIGDRDEDLGRAGWFTENCGGRTHAAGELKANPFGLYDIHGNVWEWVQDGWDATFYSQFQEKPAINPSSPYSAGSQGVIRGGDWFGPASYCRSSTRHAYSPTHRYYNLDFRVSLPVDAVRQALKVDGAKIVKPGMPVGANGNPVAEQGRSAWDDLDPAQIPEAERVPRQPEGLVAVLGQHRRRVWSRIYSTSASPDGTQFTLTTDDGLYLFNRDTKQPTRFFNDGTFYTSATFLPDGRIASFVQDIGARGLELQIFSNPRDGSPLQKQVAMTTVAGAQLPTASSDGRWLATVEPFEGEFGSIRLWRLSENPPQRAARFLFPGPHGNLIPTAFSPDAQWFCFTDNCNAQSAVHLIDLRGDTPREATALKADADENSDAPAKGFDHAAFLSDGRLATADRNGRTWFWKINDGEPERVGSIRDTGFIAAAAQSLRLVVGIGGNTFRIWDLAADPPRLLGSSSSSFSADNIGTLAIAPNGETVLTSHLNGAVRLWNVSEAGVNEIDPLVSNPRASPQHGHNLKVVDHSLCVSTESVRVGIWRPTRDGLQSLPDVSPSHIILGASRKQRQLIVESVGGGTALLECDADRVTPTRRITGNRPHSAALNDEGRRLAIVRHNDTEEVLELWGWESDDLPARKLYEIKSSPDAGTLLLAFAESGHTLVRRVGSRIEIWDVKDDQLIPRTTLPPNQYLQFAVAPDGETLATVEGQRALELWNLKSDLTKPTTSIAVPHAYAVAFSPDGRRLAASFWEHGASAGVQIINLASGVVEKRLTFPGRVHELTFTDDSRHLITGNANATIYVVRLEPAPTK